MLELILGRAGSGKTAAVMSAVARRVADGQPGTILLVPEQYSHEAERELCRVCGDRLSLYAEVLSFTGLCRRVESELGGAGKPTLDKGGRALCMAMAARAADGALRVYQGAFRRPELLGSLLSALDQLKSACAGPEALSRAAEESGGALGDKLRDLAVLMDAYDAFVSRSAADPADRLTRLAERIGRSRLCRGAVFVDGFTDFTRQEAAVLRELLLAGAHVTVCLTCDSLEEGSELFDASRRTARALLRLAKERGIPCAVREMARPFDPENPLDFLEKHLFGYTAGPFPGETERIALLRCADAEEECALAAAAALRLARETGCRWRDMAVAVRGFEDYRPALERAFRRCGVPLFVGKRTDLLKKPVPALIFSALDTVIGGWEYEDLFACLKTGLTGLEADECDVLENYVLLWELRGSAWTREGDWTQHPRGYGGVYDDEARAALDVLNALRRRVRAPLLRLQERGKQAVSAGDHCAALTDFLVELSLPERLQERSRSLRAAGRETEAGETEQLWGIVVSALEQCAAVLGDSPLTQEDFARLLRLVLSQYDVGTIPVALDRVLAGDFDRMRRRHLKHLIVLGAGDDRLPALPGEAGIFSDADREALSRLDIDLGSGEGDVYRELNLLYSCLTLPEESLTVTCPAADGTGSPVRPSALLDRLALLFGKPPRRFDREAAALCADGTAFRLAAWGGSPGALAARELYAALGRSEELRRLEEAANRDRVRLSPAAVTGLYGAQSRLSATRAEAFASCRYAYFLRYGLRAEARKPAGFQAPELGTFLHYVLENVAREVSAAGGFARVPAETVAALSDRFLEEYIHTRLGDFREKSPRFVYLFRRLAGTVRRVTADMAGELARSDFVPLDFELNFSDRSRMAPLTTADGSLELTGVADRVDGWVKGDTLYLRVVDYKTGVKRFSLSDVVSGFNLQMLLYLFALGERGKELYGAEKVSCAGVLYVPARAARVSADEALSDEALAKEQARALRRSGLLLRDEAVLAAMERSEEPRYLPVKFKNGVPGGDSLATAEQLGALARYVDQTLSALAKELRAGSIDARPSWRGPQDNACLWCDYAAVCRFDDAREARAVVPALTTEEAWAQILRGKEA